MKLDLIPTGSEADSITGTSHVKRAKGLETASFRRTLHAPPQDEEKEIGRGKAPCQLS
jgi:hypothetical protein